MKPLILLVFQLILIFDLQNFRKIILVVSKN